MCISTHSRKHLICELQLKECMKVLRHILAALCEMFSITYRDGWTGRGAHCMASTLAWLQSFGCLPVGTGKILVYAAPVDNEQALHSTVDACQTIRIYPGIFERMRRSMMRRVEACIKSHGGHSEHLFQMYSSSYNSKIKCFRTHVDNGHFLFVLISRYRVQNLFAHFSYTLSSEEHKSCISSIFSFFPPCHYFSNLSAVEISGIRHGKISLCVSKLFTETLSVLQQWEFSLILAAPTLISLCKVDGKSGLVYFIVGLWFIFLRLLYVQI
jgi:hypothetical protein